MSTLQKLKFLLTYNPYFLQVGSLIRREDRYYRVVSIKLRLFRITFSCIEVPFWDTFYIKERSGLIFSTDDKFFKDLELTSEMCNKFLYRPKSHH